jgi:hypothetical protein
VHINEQTELIDTGARLTMYEALAAEIKNVNLKRFHIITPQDHSNVTSAWDLPGSYEEFVSRFGTALLYKSGSIHLLKIIYPPQTYATAGGKPLLLVGMTDRSRAFFRVEDLAMEEPPIYEWFPNARALRKMADSFDDWIQRRSKWARRQFSREQWRTVIDGPAEFTEDELIRVRWRDSIQWKRTGVTETGDITFCVCNRGEIAVDFYTLGIRSTDREFESRVFLKTGHIQPETSAEVIQDCYKERYDPNLIECYTLPPPDPHDRSDYLEFYS